MTELTLKPHPAEYMWMFKIETGPGPERPALSRVLHLPVSGGAFPYQLFFDSADSQNLPLWCHSLLVRKVSWQVI